MNTKQFYVACIQYEYAVNQIKYKSNGIYNIHIIYKSINEQK